MNKFSGSLVLISLLMIASSFVPDLYSRPEYTGTDRTAVIVPEKQLDEILPHPGDSLVPDTGKIYKEAMIDSAIALGKTFLGLKYRYGGTTEAGFDCSGYVSYLFARFGYVFPHSSAGMATVGYEIEYRDARKGDFIFFKGRSISSPRVGHVALIIGVDSLGVQMIHSNHRGVTIDRYPQMEYYRKRYLMCRRYDF